jgi:hypothetical protein
MIVILTRVRWNLTGAWDLWGFIHKKGTWVVLEPLVEITQEWKQKKKSLHVTLQRPLPPLLQPELNSRKFFESHLLGSSNSISYPEIFVEVSGAG